jgi:hypothetical protein
MKKLIPSFFVLLSFSALLWACSQEKHANFEEMAALDSSSSHPTNSYQAQGTAKKTSEKQFIRSAEIKGKVKSVEQATYAIEKLVAHKGGFITESQLSRQDDYPHSIPISSDSLLETRRFTLSNHLTFRIPHSHFDSSLYEVALLLESLDKRIIHAQDVSFEILGHQLTQKRTQKHEKRIQKITESSSAKTGDALYGEEEAYNLSEKGDEAYVQHLSLDDQVKYSSVTVDLYQNQEVQRVVLPSYADVKAYEPHLGLKSWEALSFSFDILEGLFLFFLRIWWLVGILVFGFLYFRKKRETA